MRENFLQQRKGVILVEAMVALSLLIMAMGGLFALNLNTLRANNTTTDQVIATGLASEGIELIKYMIEQNIEDGLDWRNNITSNANRSGCFQIDYRTNHRSGNNPLTGLTVAADWRTPAPNVYRGGNCPSSTASNNPFFDTTRVEGFYQPLVYRDPGAGGNSPGYTYDAAGCVQPNCTVTGFRRMVAITTRGGLQTGCISSPCKMEITSAVEWTAAGGVPKYIILDEVAFDWTVRQCQDGIDNDGVQGIDLADPDCHGNPLDNSESR